MGTGNGEDPRSLASRVWWWGWTPDPRQLEFGDGDSDGGRVDPPSPGPGNLKSGMGAGMGIGVPCPGMKGNGAASMLSMSWVYWDWPQSRNLKPMIVSVLEAGFLWRVPLRVLQGPAARHGTITSVLSMVQVRMAGPGCLTDGCSNVHPTNLDR